MDTSELDQDLAQRIGVGFARMTGAEAVALGRDCRPSSSLLASAFRDGVLSQGCDVVDIGEVPTEVLYFQSGVSGTPGVMVTASHNPVAYNGFKFCHRRAAPIGTGSGLEIIKEVARTWDARPSSGGSGRLSRARPIPDYLDHVLGVVRPEVIDDLTVAADGANGMAGLVLKPLFKRLPANLVDIHLSPDGTFPNHPADPLNPDNLADLVDLVRGNSVDLGVAFDGDADRAVFVDESGIPLPGSTATAIIAAWFLSRHEGATIVHNLICSRSVAETVVGMGGNPVRTRVGHSYIKAVMADSGAIFGGEHSGHYYFADTFGADSATLALVVLMAVLSETGLPLSQLRRRFEPYATSGEINTEVADAGAAIRAVKANYAEFPQDALDGVTVDLGDRWFNVRASNTEPLLRLNAEAPDSDSLADLVAGALRVIRSA